MSPLHDHESDARLTRLIMDLPHGDLVAKAEQLTLASFGPLITYSRKVFIPLT